MPTFTKKPRPSFSAPKPPIPPEVTELVENDAPEKPDPIETEIIKPEVSHTKNPKAASPLEATLKEVIPPEPTPAPEPEPEKSPDINPEKPSKQTRAGTGFFSTLIVIFALILSVSGWLMYFAEKGDMNFNFKLDFLNQSTSESPTPSPQPLAPTPTPNPRTDIYLDVLNGSGVAGAAGRTADQLRALGYQITEIGNAAKQNYTETEIYTTDNFAYDSLLINDLIDAFDTATISGLLEDSSSTASAQIIVGQDWEE
jgi:hypothetical protein